MDLQDDAAGFAAACARLDGRWPAAKAAEAEVLLQHRHWDSIAESMAMLLSRLG